MTASDLVVRVLPTWAAWPRLNLPCQRGLTLAATALSLLAIGCNEVEGHPPLARIELVPGMIQEDDNFQTAVTLDATLSADPLDDPDGERPLTYRWEIIGDDHRFSEGGATSPAPVITLLGNRPATIVLVVTDEDGLSASATEHLQLVVR